MKEIAERYLRIFIYPCIKLSELQKEIAIIAICNMIEKKRKPWIKLTHEKVITRLAKLGLELNTARTRMHGVVESRQIIMYFLRQKTNLSYAAIGSVCGGFDHATALHSCRLVENRCLYDKKFREKITQLTERL